nr:hypothetical protein CFP56_38719 [Quercus suber]
MLFTFEDELDAERVLLGAPWSFDKYLIALCRYETDQPIKEIQFDMAIFWVQVHDLPAQRMTIEAAEGICQSLGRVIHYSDEDEADGGEFMRVRVEIDITKPLSRGRRVRKGTLNVQNQPFGEWIRASQLNTSRRKMISVAGQETQRGGDSQNDGKPASPCTTQRTVDVTPPTESRDECITRMESADFQESSKIENPTRLAEIFSDNDKIQAHIKEIDEALIKNSDSIALTNNIDDDIDCRNGEGADKELADSKKGGPIRVEMLDQGPSTKAIACSGPLTNSPILRTWKRINMGPKFATPVTEEIHARSKRGAQDHEQNELENTLKRKKMDMENGRRKRAGAKLFRFEAMWHHDPRCEEVLRDAWVQGLCTPTGYPLKNCISSCRAQLTQWNNREFGHVGRQIKLLKNKL